MRLVVVATAILWIPSRYSTNESNYLLLHLVMQLYIERKLF